MRTVTLICLMVSGVATSHPQNVWTTPIPIATGNFNDVHPVVANGQQWLFSSEEMLAFSRNAKDICILRTTGNGAAWSDSARYITTDSADNDYPSLIHATNSDPSTEIAMLVWQSRKNGNLDIYFSSYSHFSWSLPQPITTSLEDDRFPHVTMTSDRFFVTWEQRGRILVSEYDGITWSTPQYVTPPGDTLNHMPQVNVVSVSLVAQPLVIWEKQKGQDTTHSLMCAYRNGLTWTDPDTLVYAGDNRRPRFFKYNYTYEVQWERKAEGSSLCYFGSGDMGGGKFHLQAIDPLTPFPDYQRNTSVNGFMFITSPDDPGAAWYAVAAWESAGIGSDSIGVGRGPFSFSNEKLGAAGAASNQNPDVSQGTRVTPGFNVRFWVVWEATILGRIQLYGSNIVVIIDNVKDGNDIPKVLELQQNYPNPFNPSTEIRFSVESTGPATVEVFDILGKKLLTLFDGIAVAAQYYNLRFDAANLSSGLYFYRLSSGSKNELRKMLILK